MAARHPQTVLGDEAVVKLLQHGALGIERAKMQRLHAGSLVERIDPDVLDPSRLLGRRRIPC
jgi:hypothetical protein